MRDLFYVLAGFAVLCFVVFGWISYQFVAASLAPNSAGCFSGVGGLAVGYAAILIGLPALFLSMVFGGISYLIWQKYIK